VELWEVLGYDRVAAEIIYALGDSSDIDLIEGPPGVGKSWLAKGVGALWESAGGSTVLVEGDEGKRDVALYPYRSAMFQLPSWAASLVPVVAALAKAGESLVGTEGRVTEAVERLAAAIAVRKRGATILLDDAEHDVLNDLERLASKRPLLIIADNLHWWDARSLDLLRRMRDERMWESYPFLAEMRVLAVQTLSRYQAPSNPQERDALLRPLGTRRFTLTAVPADGFDLVLAALGDMPPPGIAIANAVHTLSNGHLALARKCAERIKAGEAESLLSAADSDELVDRLLSERVRNLGPLGQPAIELLQIASILGLAFDRDEVICASDTEARTTAHLLRFCREEKILEISDENWTFVHDRFRRYFRDLEPGDRVGIYERWAECLRQLRPSQYDMRCTNALDAERPDQAGALGVLAAMSRVRDGRPWEELPDRIVDAIEDAGLTEGLEQMVTAHRDLNAYRFQGCLDALDSLPHDLPKPIRAEADYLRAMCLMSTRGESDRAVGRTVLEAWRGYELNEPEQGGRLMLLLLYGYFHLLDKDPAWKLDGELRRFLNERLHLDLAARDSLHTLERMAGGLYESDTALRKARAAATYFRPADGQSVVRRPIEYYRCLVNLGANLIGNGNYEEAATVHLETMALVDSYDEGVFPRTDYPLMNGLLAEYRLGVIDAKEAARRQRRIVDAHQLDGDPFYVENALAVYLVLSGDTAAALEIYARLENDLFSSRRRPEPSMVYLIKANRCATRYLAGEVTEARVEWRSLASIAADSAYTDRAVVLRRHELLGELIEAEEVLSAHAFDEYLVSHRPDEMGPLWETSGHGFMLPAIEFWREN
jgi:hypothetical protein